jgi:iron complex transport system ATP-binding protein
MISVNDISVTIGNKVLLNKVSASFEPGKMNLIIGPNGAGKSTLIKVLSRQLAPTSGRVNYDGTDVNTLSISDLAKIRSVLSQNVALAFPLRVSEVVMMGRYPHFVGKPGPHDEQAVQEAMKFFDVSDLADRNYLTLSGGEKQRVQFARVLCQIWHSQGQLRYLMLDEPLTFLDIHYQFQFMNQVTALLSKMDLVVIGVVHDLNLAARFADSILLLHEGRVLAQGSKKDVLTKQNIMTAFQMEPQIIHSDTSQRSFLFFE